MSLEIRDLSEEKIFEMYRRIVAESAAIARRYGTEIDFAHIDVDAKPAPTDERLRTVIANSAEQLGLSYKAMPSGADVLLQTFLAIDAGALEL